MVKHLQRVAEEKQARLEKLAGAGRRGGAERKGGAERARVGRARVPPTPRAGSTCRCARRRERPRSLRARRADRPARCAVSRARRAHRAAPAATPPPAARPHRGPRPREKQKDFEFVEERGRGRSELPPLKLLQLESEKAPIDEDELVASARRSARAAPSSASRGRSRGSARAGDHGVRAPARARRQGGQIVNLQDDLALALKAESVRIDRIPGRSTLGVEVPNPKRAIIRARHDAVEERFRKSPSKLRSPSA